jgi:hypothetical protein
VSRVGMVHCRAAGSGRLRAASIAPIAKNDKQRGARFLGLKWAPYTIFFRMRPTVSQVREETCFPN